MEDSGLYEQAMVKYKNDLRDYLDDPVNMDRPTKPRKPRIRPLNFYGRQEKDNSAGYCYGNCECECENMHCTVDCRDCEFLVDVRALLHRG